MSIEFTGYRCDHCTAWGLSPEAVERHCLCEKPGCDDVKQRGWIYCSEHRAEAHRAKEAAEREAYFTLPVAEGYDGPVLVGYTWYGSPDEATEALWDDGEDIATAIAYPANVTRPKIGPRLADSIGTWLCDEMATDDDEGPEVDATAEAMITALAAHIDTHIVRDVWNVDTTRRVVLPEVAP